MFVAKKQDATLEVQSGAFYAPQNPISQLVPPGYGIERKPPRNLVLGLKKWIGHVRCKKTRRNFGSIKWCIVCAPKSDLTTGTSRQRNRAKPPRNVVLGLKKWIGQVHCENKTQLRKHKVVHFMHPKTRSHNLYHPVTESRETTQKLSFGPIEVDWAFVAKKQDATSEA